MRNDLYTRALAKAQSELDAYGTLNMARFPPLTRDQRMAIKTMLADSWLTGYDAAETDAATDEAE
jgi:hypothetical protein